MRTLHIVGGRKLGGAERFFVRLVNSLAGHGESVAVVTVAGGEIDAAVHPEIPRYHATQAGVWDLWSRWRIAQAVRHFQPAVVQTYMGRATRLTHLPRNGLPVHLARLGGYYNLKGYRHAHAWIGNTQGIRDYLVARGLPARRVFHIGNFVDPAPPLPADSLAQLRAQWGIPVDALVILGLGRLHANKGFADLLDAFVRLPEAHGNRSLRLVLVGDGPLAKELRSQAEALGLNQRVVWAGWQYNPVPWYQMADVFVCPSRHEPLGNVILEAWANRVPVVSTAAQGPKELVEPGVNGFLAPVANPQALAEAMQEALALGQARHQEMIAAGLAEVEGRFSEQAIVQAYLDLYRQLAGS